MRDLTKMQKKILTKEWERLRTQEKIEYPHMDDIPFETYLAIDDLHPCEIFHWNVEHFFDDLNSKALKEKHDLPFYLRDLDK